MKRMVLAGPQGRLDRVLVVVIGAREDSEVYDIANKRIKVHDL